MVTVVVIAPLAVTPWGNVPNESWMLSPRSSSVSWVALKVTAPEVSPLLMVTLALPRE